MYSPSLAKRDVFQINVFYDFILIFSSSCDVISIPPSCRFQSLTRHSRARNSTALRLWRPRVPSRGDARTATRQRDSTDTSACTCVSATGPRYVSHSSARACWALYPGSGRPLRLPLLRVDAFGVLGQSIVSALVVGRRQIPVESQNPSQVGRARKTKKPPHERRRANVA